MKESSIFIGPIWAHYRKSLIDELIQKNPDVLFYGAKKYLTNKPIENNDNIKNIFKIRSFKILNHTFYWYKDFFKTIDFKNTKNIVIVGFDPHMIHLIILVFYLKFVLKRKFYWWSHANYGDQGRLGLLIRLFFYSQAKGVLSYSKDGRNRLINEGFQAQKIKVLNNCLNYEDYGWLHYPLDSIKKSSQSFNVILTGKLNKEKKIHLLIEAVEILNKNNHNIFCTIVGDGDLFHELKKMILDKGIESNVKLVGPKYGKEIHKFFLNADLYIIPGAVGLSIVHGFSFGLPILTSNKMEIHRPEIELLNPGVNGDFFNDNDSKSLAEKILEWRTKITNNCRKKFINNCVNSIKNFKYLPDKVANNIYDKINE